jgi:hypothetical protein
MQNFEQEAKNPENPELQRFMSARDNTHNKYTSVTALSAIMTLTRNHKVSPHAHAEITSELIKNGVLPKDQAKAREFKYLLDDIATRNQDQWDYVPCFNHETGEEENIQVRMAEVLQYLIAAIQDQSKFTRTTYPERLKKFHDLILWFREGECNTGRRHDLIIEMLHDDYEGVYIVTECKSSVEILTARFYERKLVELLNQDPEKGYRLLCEWIDGTSPCVLKETPTLDDFFKDRAELEDYLVGFFEDRGFLVNFESLDKSLESAQAISPTKKTEEPEHVKLARYIVDIVNARASLPFACPDEYKKEIGLLAELWQQQKKLPTDIKQLLNDCRRLQNLQSQGLDVYILCVRLKTKSLSYQPLLSLGGEEGALVSWARDIYHSTTRYLEKPPDWPSLRAELTGFDERLAQAIDLAAKQPHSELIRDSLSMLSGEQNILQFTAIHQKITTCFIRNNLALTDDAAMTRWVEQFLELQEGRQVVTLTPYNLNRVCWHALTTSPLKWSENFIRLLELVVLPLIQLAKSGDDSIDENNKVFIRHSYPEDLVGQLNWLLILAKNPERQLKIIPHLFVPCNLAGFHVEKFTSLEGLSTFLRGITQRGGRWPVWMEGVDVDSLDFQDPADFKIFAHLLLYCPVADRFNILNKGWRSVSNIKRLAFTLQLFELPDRHAILDRGWNLISNAQYLFAILQFFPAADRKVLIEKTWRLIDDTQWLAKVLRTIQPVDRLVLAVKFNRLYKNFESLVIVARVLPLREGVLFFSNYSQLVTQVVHLINVVEKYSVEAECIALAIKCMGVIQKNADMIKLLKHFPLVVRLGLVEVYLQNGRARKGLPDILKMLPEADRIAILEKHGAFLADFEDLMMANELYSTEQFARLVDKHVKLVKYAGQLITLLPLILEEKRAAIVDKYKELLKYSTDYVKVLAQLPEDERAATVVKYWDLIKDESDLFMLLHNGQIPLLARRALVEKGWHFFKKGMEFACVLSTLPASEADELLEKGLFLITHGAHLGTAMNALSAQGREYWVEKGWDKIGDGLGLAHVLVNFSGKRREELLNKGWYLIKDGFQLCDVAVRYPLEERRALFDRGWDLIKNANHLTCVISSAAESDSAVLFATGRHLLIKDDDFIHFIKEHLLVHAISDSRQLLLKECMTNLISCQDPFKVVKKVFHEFAIFERMRKITIKKGADSKGALPVFAKPKDCRILIQPCFHLIKTFDQLLEVLSDCPKRYRFWIVEACWGLVKDQRQLTLITPFFQGEDVAALVAKGIGLPQADNSEQISAHFNRDSPLNTRRSGENNHYAEEVGREATLSWESVEEIGFTPK